MKKKKFPISGIIKWVIALPWLLCRCTPSSIFTSSFKSLDDFGESPAYALPSKWVLTNFINVLQRAIC